MSPYRMRQRQVLALCLLALGACGGSSQLVCKKDVVTGLENCQPTSSSPGGAAVQAGTAAAVWGVAGCTVNGCETPYRCNAKTKQCEPIHCAEGQSCPPAYTCDVEHNRCK